MSVGVLLVTHPGIGTAIMQSAKRIIDDCPLQTKCLEVPLDTGLARTRENALSLIHTLDEGQGVLVLTDIYGATPNNLSRQFAQRERVAVLAGLNLPMLVRVYNYPDGSLKTLCEKALEGGTRGVHQCTLE